MQKSLHLLGFGSPIEFVSEVFVPFGHSLTFDNVFSEYEVDTTTHVYFIDRYGILRKAFEVIDEAGFIVALVDAVIGATIDMFN